MIRVIKLAKSFRVAAVLALVSLALAAGAHAADPAGVWKTPPDKFGQTAHIVASRCGQAYCGTITEVFDPQGRKIAGKNVGVRVFWDMMPSGDAYKGRAFVPAYGKVYTGRMAVRGNTMKVSGCLGGVCKGQTWTRVR